MDVRLGWSGEIHGTWTKMDVEVSEEDLRLLFAEKDANPALLTSLTSIEKFKLMYMLAEVFVQLHKMSRFPDVFGTPQDKQELQELVTARDSVLEAVRARG